MGEQNVSIHAAHWPALSTIAGFDAVANPQIQAMMLNHALTAQCFVVCASGPTSPEAIQYIEAELGPQQVVLAKCAASCWAMLCYSTSLLFCVMLCYAIAVLCCALLCCAVTPCSVI